jgi:biopolymer transport protein ExbB
MKAYRRLAAATLMAAFVAVPVHAQDGGSATLDELLRQVEQRSCRGMTRPINSACSSFSSSRRNRPGFSRKPARHARPRKRRSDDLETRFEQNELLIREVHEPARRAPGRAARAVRRAAAGLGRRPQPVPELGHQRRVPGACGVPGLAGAAHGIDLPARLDRGDRATVVRTAARSHRARQGQAVAEFPRDHRGRSRGVRGRRSRWRLQPGGGWPLPASQPRNQFRVRNFSASLHSGAFVTSTSDLVRGTTDSDGFVRFGVDITRGQLLSLLIETPNLRERIEQGQAVGYVIIALGILGLLLSLERLITLGIAGRKVSAQLKSKEPRANNALGSCAAGPSAEQERRYRNAGA